MADVKGFTVSFSMMALTPWMGVPSKVSMDPSRFGRGQGGTDDGGETDQQSRDRIRDLLKK